MWRGVSCRSNSYSSKNSTEMEAAVLAIVTITWNTASLSWKLRTLKTDCVYSVCSLCVKITQCLSVCTLTPVLVLVWRPCCVHTVCTLNWRPGSLFVSLHSTLRLNVWRPCGVWVILIADRYWCSAGELPDRVMVFGQWLLTSGWLPVAVCTQWVFETLPTARGLAPASSPIYPILLSALSC